MNFRIRYSLFTIQYSLCAFEDMPEIQLMDRNQIFHCHGIFLNIQHARAAEVDNAIAIKRSNHFSDAVVFGTRSVIYQITELDIIIRSSVIWVDNR